MFLKIYNYFVRGLVLFLLICIPYSLVTNPELIEDEVDFYFFVIAYVLILLFYVVWNYIYNYLRRKKRLSFVHIHLPLVLEAILFFVDCFILAYL